MRDWVAQSASWRKAGGVLPVQMLRLSCWYKCYNPKRSSRGSLLRLFNLPYRTGNFLCGGKVQCCRGVGRRIANKKLVLVHFWRLVLRMANMAVLKGLEGDLAENCWENAVISHFLFLLLYTSLYSSVLCMGLFELFFPRLWLSELSKKAKFGCAEGRGWRRFPVVVADSPRMPPAILLTSTSSKLWLSLY